jgi:hypothetical protein
MFLSRITALAPSMSSITASSICVCLDTLDNDDILEAMCTLIEAIQRKQPAITTTEHDATTGATPLAVEPEEPLDFSHLTLYIQTLGVECVTVNTLTKLCRAVEAGVPISKIVLCGSLFKTVQNDSRMNLRSQDYDDEHAISGFLRSVCKVSKEMLAAGMDLVMDKMISNAQHQDTDHVYVDMDTEMEIAREKMNSKHGVDDVFLDMEKVYDDHFSSIMTGVSAKNYEHMQCAARVRHNIEASKIRRVALSGTLTNINAGLDKFPVRDVHVAS